MRVRARTPERRASLREAIGAVHAPERMAPGFPLFLACVLSGPVVGVSADSGELLSVFKDPSPRHVKPGLMRATIKTRPQAKPELVRLARQLPTCLRYEASDGLGCPATSVGTPAPLTGDSSWSLERTIAAALMLAI